MDRISRRDCDPNSEQVHSTKAVLLGSKYPSLNMRELNIILSENRMTKRDQMV